MQFIVLLISLFVAQPIAEYWLHRFVHFMRLEYHMSHHAYSSHGKYWGYKGDFTCRMLIVMLAVHGYHVAALALLKYEVTHTAVHRVPGLRYLHRHHFLHHRKPNVNYSFSAIWPDRLFGTLEI